jgi:hypothetical protein
MTCFSLPVVHAVSAAGTVTALTANTLEDADASWAAGQFGTNGAFYVEFDCGTMADILGCDAVARRLVVSGPLPDTITVGDSYRIRRHWTLAGIFGARNEAGLKAGINPTEADMVVLLLPETQEQRRCFYVNAPGYEGWWDYGMRVRMDNQVIYPEQGVAVERKNPANVVVCASGVSKQSLTRVPISPGDNLVGLVDCFSPRRLSELGLYTGDPATGVAAGENINGADNLVIIRPNGEFTYFYYAGRYAAAGWYDSSYGPANDVLISPGSVFSVRRKGSRGLFFWDVPHE